MLLSVPLFVTFVILRMIFNVFARNLRPLLKISERMDVPEYVVAGATVLIMILSLYAIGALASHVVGRRFISWVESLLGRIPVVKTLYSSTKTVVDMLSSSNRQAFKCVVSVDFPRPGMRAIGFMTGIFHDAENRRFAKIFVPTTPNPTSGFLFMMPWDDVHVVDIGIEEGLKMIISGGMISPATMNLMEGRPLSASDLAPPVDGPKPQEK